MTQPQSPAAPEVGNFYKDDRVLEKLGPGGTSDVFLMHDTVLKRRFVLKRGRPSAEYPRARLVELFRNEFRILNALGRPFAPDAYGADLDVPELKMEYLEGTYPLDAILGAWIGTPAKFPDDPDLIDLGLVLLGAVTECHARGVVLADLKPRNVLVTPARPPGLPAVTLIDFGSSILEQEPLPSRDYSAGYGAPELLSGDVPQRAADVYSLGAILFAFFARVEPGADRSPGEFGDRQTQVLPALQDLIRRMTSADPLARPEPAAVGQRLRVCKRELVDARNNTGVRCPHCWAAVLVRGASHCQACGRAIQRITHRLADDLAGGPIERMYEADQKGSAVDVLFWARVAVQSGKLTPAAAVLGAEVAARVPGELGFAGELLASAGAATLGDELRRRYLVCLGEVLTRRKEPLTPHRAALREAAARWPAAEKLWVWAALASPPEDREPVLCAGLKRHPTNKDLWYQLGELQFRRNRYREALDAWKKALDNGHRTVKFVYGLCQLAENLNDSSQLGELRAVLRGCTPTGPEEYVLVSRVYQRERDMVAALDAVTRGLKTAPFHPELRERMAELLYHQVKYELVVEPYEEQLARPDGLQAAPLGLLKWIAISLSNLNREAEALALLTRIAPAGKDPKLWYYLARCHDRLKNQAAARAAVRDGLERFPTDDDLRRLAGVLGAR